MEGHWGWVAQAAHVLPLTHRWLAGWRHLSPLAHHLLPEGRFYSEVWAEPVQSLWKLVLLERQSGPWSSLAWPWQEIRKILASPWYSLRPESGCERLRNVRWRLLPRQDGQCIWILKDSRNAPLYTRVRQPSGLPHRRWWRSARSPLCYNSSRDCFNPTVHLLRAISLDIESPRRRHNFKQVVPHHYVTLLALLDFVNFFKWYYPQRLLFQFRLEVAYCVFIQLKISSLPVFHHGSLFHTIPSFDDCTVCRWLRSKVRKMALWPFQIVSVDTLTTFVYFFFLCWSDDGYATNNISSVRHLLLATVTLATQVIRGRLWVWLLWYCNFYSFVQDIYPLH